MKTEIRQRYWEDFKKICSEMNAPLTLHTPRDANRIGVNLGPNLNLGFKIEAVANARIPQINSNNIAIRISMPKAGWKTIAKNGDLKKEFRSSCLMTPLETGKYTGGQQIILHKKTNPERESNWKRQFEWFVENFWKCAELFRLYFRPDFPPLKKYVKPRPAKRANELDGKTWLRYSLSVWDDVKKTTEERRLKHPGSYPIALASRLIQAFTNEQGRLVFDPFAGVGSTLIAAKELGKDSIGLELSSEFASIAATRLNQRTLFDGKAKTKVHNADSRDLRKYVSANSVDMVVTSPPYWDILLEKRTVDGKDPVAYSDLGTDLGNIRDYEKFLLELRRIFEEVHYVMKPGSYCCVVVMDIRKKSRFYPYHMDISLFMQDIGFIFDDLIIWTRGGEYSKLRPLGYPSVFRVNKVHEFILIFQKPKNSNLKRKD